MDHTPRNQNKTSPAFELEMVMSKEFSNVFATICSRGAMLFGSINVIRRNERDYLALVKATQMPMLDKVIAFGAGATYAEALTSLNKSIAAGHWKIDKPWESRA